MGAKVCSRCGHATKTRSGPCPDCKRDLDRARSTESNKRYGNPEYRSNREIALRRDRYECVRPGCGRPARQTNHIVAITDGGTHDVDNLESVCIDHHAEADALARRLRRKRNLR